jgi:predicted Zn-dependent protease
MNTTRVILLVLILAGASAIVSYLFVNPTASSLRPTLAPAFQLAGKSTQIADQLLTKVIPIDELDEKQLGEAFARYFPIDTSDSVDRYLNDLISNLSHYARKPFKYRVAKVNWGDVPNAFAMPGGVIVVSTGLISIVKSESELVAVLAHEMGHVELGHCFDMMKFTMLSRKITNMPLGELADFAYHLLIGTSFSKTQEDEADDYAFQLVAETNYDPRGISRAFISLMTFETTKAHSDTSFNPVRDYLQSHPATSLRANKFSEKADQWWKDHLLTPRYVGVANLQRRESYYRHELHEEWVYE